MAILSGPEIIKQQESGNIDIDPFDEDHVGPNSVDLTLAKDLKIYIDKDGTPVDESYREAEHAYGKSGNRDDYFYDHLNQKSAVLDCRKPNKTKRITIPEEGRVLEPGKGYLGATVESIWSDKFVPILHGRSSIGRLFLSVHHTAGFGDSGFLGTWTLEITVVHPVRVYPGMRICQCAFEEMKGDPLLYSQRSGSKYMNQKEPRESEMFRDFRFSSTDKEDDE